MMTSVMKYELVKAIGSGSSIARIIHVFHIRRPISSIRLTIAVVMVSDENGLLCCFRILSLVVTSR